MTTKDLVDRLAGFIRELTEFYGELAEELPQLHFVGASASAISELKKIARRLYRFRAERGTKSKSIVLRVKKDVQI